MTTIKNYKDLIIWQKSIMLVKIIYQITQSFPKEEQYGITNQLRRCAVSIPSNIAEGYGRNSTNDYIRFLQIATGSLYELETQVEISFQLNYMTQLQKDEVFNLCTEIDKMIYSLIQKIKQS